jgi:hypothetical protein
MDDATRERLLDRLDAAGANENCPACDTFEWSFGTKIGFFQAAEHGNKELLPGAGYPVLFLICENCGFMRPHYIPVLEGEEAIDIEAKPPDEHRKASEAD